MFSSIRERVAAARAGANPTIICRMPSGWLALGDRQFLPGYCFLLPDPVVDSLNDLEEAQRAAYLCDMALAGDALLEVTGAYRINYAILGNGDPELHAHIVPRYRDEPEELRCGLPWSYPREVVAAAPFDLKRCHPLMQQIAEAVTKRL